ncbi:MAG TPA: SRPBCC domain-containing protein [Candidatus Nanopelagicales bacterium]
MEQFPVDERIVHWSATVDAPVEDAWWAWTTDAGIRSWLVDDSRVELRVGGPYEWFFLDEGSPGGRGSEGCVVVGFQAPTMLTFTWNAPPHLAQARAQRTVVLLRLRPVDDDERTRVELTQLGWGDGGEWDEAFDYFDAAWGRVLARLVAFFAGIEELPEA